MIKRKGDLFTTDAPAIGHGVNCRGLMGAGIALQFKERFPRNYYKYTERCRNNMIGGDVEMTYDARSEWYIMNMATQFNPGNNARIEYVYAAAKDASKYAIGFDLDRIAIPMIGCGIGGLKWPDVEDVLLDLEQHFNVEWEVWKYE